VTQWFEHWFGEEYLDLYPHRDDREAERVVALLTARGVCRPGDRVLDLACGAGRHAAAFARCGAMVVGLDLSIPLLLGARRRSPARLVRADMRVVPLRAGSFDVVVNLFTSFGYFDGDAEHEAVLAEVARVLRPGGGFVLDYLNAPQVRSTLVARDERAVGRRRVVQERRLSEDARYVVKSIRLEGEGRTFMERVRLYEREEIERMLVAHGLAPRHVWGDYDGRPHTASSPRLCVVARRS
jgi:SAM-dependent methyltransferase